jgi:hypothetical protein
MLSRQGHEYEATSEFKTVNTEVWQVRSRVLKSIGTPMDARSVG